MSYKKKHLESRHISRRQFLMGSGSAFLVLPPLLSLMPEKVMAQVTSTPRRRSVTWLGLLGIDGQHLWPSNPTGLIQQPGLHVYSKPLNQFSGNISRLIDSDFVSMYPHMNLMEGLSLTGGNYQGHNTGVLAGCHDDRTPKYGRSIDAVLENSTGVYKPGEVVAQKAVRVFTGDHDLANFYYFDANGNLKTSEGLQGDKNLFNTLFKNFSAPASGGQTVGDDKLIVDRVYEDLKKLETNSRMSKEDKAVLGQYINSIYELQLKVNANSGGPTCTMPTIDFQATKQGNYWWLPEDGWGIRDCGKMYDNYIELIKLAFACDLTRVVTVSCTLWTDAVINRDSNGGLHHEAGGSEIAADRQKWGLKKFLKLAQALSATPDSYGSGSLLDNSILLYTNELGDWTTGHNTLSLPAVTFGKCGGYFKTGNYVDFRQKPLRRAGNNSGCTLGRPYKQLLQSIMTAMGVPKSEYSKYGDGKGFGQFVEGINQFGEVVPTAFTPYANEHNNPLPWIGG